jgi:hypothetical protein
MVVLEIHLLQTHLRVIMVEMDFLVPVPVVAEVPGEQELLFQAPTVVTVGWLKHPQLVAQLFIMLAEAAVGLIAVRQHLSTPDWVVEHL